MAVSAIFWTRVNPFDTPSDERALQAPNGASRDRHQCVLAGHLARALGLTMPDIAVTIALVLSSGSLAVSIAGFVLAISAKRQAKKAATLGFRVEAINHLRAVLYEIDNGGVTSRTVDTVHD